MQRWPFRKRNSLGRLIDRTKQVLDDGTGQDNMQKLAALQVLEKQRQVMRVSFAGFRFSFVHMLRWPARSMQSYVLTYICFRKQTIVEESGVQEISC